MTAVTGDYALNFSGASNESPWVEDDWSDVTGQFQINTNGLRPVVDEAVSILAGQTWDTTIRSKIEIISNSMTYGDYLGPAIIVEGGAAYTGYVLRCNGENLDVSKYTAGVRDGLISTSVGTVADGDTYELQVDASGASAVITAYRNGSQITALNYTDSDTPFLTDLAGGVWGSAENSNGRRIGSIAFDGVDTGGGAATQLEFGNQPQNTVVGQTMAAVTVNATDSGSVTDTSFTGNVTIALQTGSGTLAGTLTKAAVAGVATFDDLSINTLNTNAVLRATSSGLTQDDSATFNITAGSGGGSITGSLIGSALVS